MRRYILFALLLCLQWTARGQATYDYRYWFDSDEENQRTGTVMADNWHIDADLSGLDCSLHSIHIQVKDTAGVWSVPVTKHFVKLPEKGLMNAFYWFDSDYSGRKSVPSVNGKLDIDVSGLTDAFHYFYYQASDEKGNASNPKSAYFVKLPNVKKEMTYRYWVDNDNSTMHSGKFNGGAMMIDVADIEDGFHVIYFQVDGNGSASVPANRMFIKIPQTDNIGEMTCLCFIDGKVYKQEQVPSAGGTVNWEIDVNSISQGIHRLQVQVLTPSGAASNLYDSFFFRSEIKSEIQEMQLLYSIDNEEYKKAAGSYANGLFHFDVDVASLNDGLHNMSYMLASDRGTMTKVSSTLFLKTPLGGPGIMSYKYWINEFETEAEYVKLSERKNPYELISLLPVKSAPIRSNCFKFEISDGGTPMMYAKNDIHMQFFDVSNRVVEAHKQYVDYNVGQEIEDFTLLESGKRVYKVKPGKDEVVWFKVDAERGDSLTFKTDLAASIDVFNSNGDTLYNAYGTNAVKYDGCRVDETGTYYVALHDVTAKNGTNIALDYVKIDKYTVLSTTPTTFGCPSKINMNLYGNGFSDSTKVAICKDDSVIWANSINYTSISDITAYFDFIEIPFGKYDLRVIYTDTDSLTFENHICIEEADSTTNVSIALKGNPFFLAGARTTYEIEITNHSNIPVYSLPFTLSFECEGNEENIPYIKFEQEFGKEYKERLRKSLMLDIDKEYVDEIIRYYYGDDNDISMFYVHKDSITGEEFLVGNFVQPCVPANSTVVIPFTLQKINHNIKIYASTKKNWDMGRTENQGSVSAKARNGVGKDCCVKEALDCIFTLAETATPILLDDFASDCVFGYVKETSAGIFTDILCRGEQPDFSKFPKAPAPVLQELGTTIIQCAIDNIKSKAAELGEEAVEALIEKYSKDLAKKISGKILKTYSITKDCVYTPIKSWVKGCGDDDDDDHDADPINSYDPNDIYGYRAESGSKAVMKGQKELYYTIEFENDTAFATASAQDVYLTDTLDSRYFDLKSYSPTSLKIGDKKVELNGEADFVTTVDMRPRINAIAQVECDYDSKTGIAKWHFSSLDPMTMEPVETPMDGFLPVNNSDGDGMGEVSFNINLKDDFEDGTEISNRASIVFDYNEAIITPIWTNVIDTIAPKGNITRSEMKNDSTLTLHLGGTDNRSGIWKYDIYVQPEEDCSWYKAGENIADTVFNFTIREGIDYGFCVVATDSAGNVEVKTLERQWSASAFKLGDANGDRTIDAADVVLTISKYLGNDVEINTIAADVNSDGVIDAQDIVGIQQIFLVTESKARMTVTKKRIRLWQRQ